MPAPGGAAIDHLYARALIELREPALATLETASGLCDGWIRTFLGQLHAAIGNLPSHDFLAAFKPSVAFFDLHPIVIGHDPLKAALSLACFIIGGPSLGTTALVIPEEALGEDGLYLPHLNVVLRGGWGPVAAEGTAGGVRLTWTDGLSVAVPCGLTPEADEAHGRLLYLESVDGWPVLNPIAQTRNPLLPVLPQPEPDANPLEVATLAAGLGLLKEVWPLGHAATRRFLHSAILQPVLPDHSTSVTLDFLQGTFIASCRDAVQVADALVHEGSHARLAVLLRADPLILDDSLEQFDSPWRRDKRPLKGLLNGVHAFLNVALFYRHLADKRPEMADYASEIFEVQRGKVKKGWATCAASARATALGQTFLGELEAEVDKL